MVKIDTGATLRGRALFGANKTWRGVVALGTVVGFGLLTVVHRARGGRRQL